MRRISMLLLVALFVLGVGASAGTWQYYDFGDPFDEGNNTTPLALPNSLPAPGLTGSGGELYDLEGLHIAMDNDYLYVALANSFGFRVVGTHYTFYQGDIFFGTGDPKQTAEWAINMEQDVETFDVNNTVLSKVETWAGAEVNPASYGGTAIGNDAGPYKVLSSYADYGMDHALTLWPDYETNPFFGDAPQDVYVHEFRISLDLLNFASGETVYFHTTIGCANDAIRDNITIPGVPEPATLILLGLGLTGAGLFVRRK